MASLKVHIKYPSLSYQKDNESRLTYETTGKKVILVVSSKAGKEIARQDTQVRSKYRSRIEFNRIDAIQMYMKDRFLETHIINSE